MSGVSGVKPGAVAAAISDAFYNGKIDRDTRNYLLEMVDAGQLSVAMKHPAVKEALTDTLDYVSSVVMGKDQPQTPVRPVSYK